MTPAELIHLRDRLLRGDPPYERDSMGALRRSTGTPGYHELQRISDYSPLANTQRMIMDAVVKLTEHLLESEREREAREG